MARTVDVVVRARDEASKKFGTIGKSSMRMSSLLKRAAVGVGFYFGARQVASIIRYGAEFEKTMSRVKALTQANESEHRRLTAAAKKLGETTVFTARQVADGMSYLALAGFEVDEIIASMPATLDLAAAGQIELGSACDITAKIMRGMGLDTDQLGNAVDVLTKGFTTATTDVEMLGEAFSYVGPIGRMAGMRFEELTSIIQVLSDNNIQASRAGTTLRQIIGVLSGSSAAASKKLGDLGIKVRTASGGFRPMADIVDSLNQAIARMGKVEKTGLMLEIFGKRAGPGMAALLQTGSGALRDYEKALDEAAGTAKQIAETQLDNVAGELTKIGSVSSGIILELYGKLQVWLKDYLARFRAGLTVMGVVINNMGLLWDIFWTKAKLSMVTWWEDTKHLFSTVIPDLLKWFQRNWAHLFLDLLSGTEAIFVNMGKNIGNFFKNVWSWLKGDETDFKWTALLDGFESTLREMPEIAKRGISETEKALRAELDDLKLQFAQKITDKFEEEKAAITVAAKKATAKVMDIEDEEGKKTAMAVKQAALKATEARFLTFAPGTRFDYQKVMAENTGKQATTSEKILDTTKEQVTLTREILAETMKSPSPAMKPVVDWDKAIKKSFKDSLVPARTGKESPSPVMKLVVDWDKAIKKSFKDSLAKKDGENGEQKSIAENTARQVMVSEQLLENARQDDSNETAKKQINLTSKIVDVSKQQVVIAKETLTQIKELSSGGVTLVESNFL